MSRERVRVGLVAAAVIVWAGGVSADVVSEQSGSILVFPKVIATGNQDTIIQISNTSNSMVHAHCFYVNGALTDPTRPQSPTNPPRWTEIDFDIWLTKQQPTYWVVSEGRLVDPDDEPCRGAAVDCPNSGLDPGRVPPVVADFTGELKCIEVDPSGAPLSGNHLKGEATVVTFNTCVSGTCSVSGDACSTTCPEAYDYAKYNAVGILGNENNNGDGVLCLGGGAVPSSCPNGAEYNACPQHWIYTGYSDDGEDSLLDEEVTPSITVVPCTQNFETQVPTAVTIQFAITNEYEQTFSASTTVTCWADLELASINQVFTEAFVGTDMIQARMRSSAGSNSGFIAIATDVHTNGTNETARAAVNLHVDGERTGGDVITIPAEQTRN